MPTDAVATAVADTGDCCLKFLRELPWPKNKRQFSFKEHLLRFILQEKCHAVEYL